MSLHRKLFVGIVAGSLVKSAHASLNASPAWAITCDELKTGENNYSNPTRYLYRQNCVDWDAPTGFPNVTQQAHTFKNPAPQVIGSRAVAKEYCNGAWRTMFDTGLLYSYNASYRTVTGVGTYAQCMNHDTRFRSQHNYYQSDPYLNQVNYLCIPTCPPL